MIQLLLTTLLAVQEPAAPKPEWRDVDGLLFVINEDTVTKHGYMTLRQRFTANNPNIDPARADRVLQDEIKNNAVGSQAGEAMGIDAKLIKIAVRDHERRLIDFYGGVDQYAAILKQRHQTAEEFRDEVEKQVLREKWEDSRTGKGPNEAQAIIADRFVRPGALRLTYSELAHNPRSVALIGGSSSKIVLQILEVDPVKAGGTAEVESVARGIREDIAAGRSDFESESLRLALSTSKSGPTEPLDEASLAETDPRLALLVAGAKEGEVLPLLAPLDSTLYWRVVKLVKRIPAEVPDFKAAGLQKTVRTLIEESLDKRRLDRAREQQFESSYIWVWPPALAGR